MQTSLVPVNIVMFMSRLEETMQHIFKEISISRVQLRGAIQFLEPLSFKGQCQRDGSSLAAVFSKLFSFFFLF